MSKLKDHPLAEIFPLMPDAEIVSLAEDIKAHGCKSKITMYEGKILDGRNRYRACLLAEVEPITVEFKGDDPLAHVVSLNLYRRQLTASQRAEVAARLAKDDVLRHDANLGKAQQKAAKTMDVDPATVRAAARVIEKAPDLADDVRDGKTTIHAAEKEIEARQKEKVKAAGGRLSLPIDERGVTLPANRVALWNRRNEVSDMAGQISKMRCAIRDAQKGKDPLYSSLSYGSVLPRLDQIYTELTAIKPWCVCASCQGGGCRLCKDTGLLGKFAFEKFVPAELKKRDER